MSSSALEQAVSARRTFAIISHPDAGKTTLTEKLLLCGGAIRMAGAVKTRGEQRRARSDWMKIEQSRGISVTTSVMTFERDGITFNLLDTPGHEDFSEDTYRTLTAVDSAIMVIDVAKGIETQTRKLFEVCRLRDMPIITFVNKLDREGRDIFELMDDIADQLALDVTPLTWPIGIGSDFSGIYDLVNDRVAKVIGKEEMEIIQLDSIDDPKLNDIFDETIVQQLRDDVELVRGACPEFDVQAYQEGHLSPIFFGSALRSFGVEDLVNGLAAYAPSPRTQTSQKRDIEPVENKVSGFVFKVQANMDKNHRDRVAFFRIVSGKFKRGMKLQHIRSGKAMAIYNPILFFAQDRELAEEAWPGDIIGIPNHGSLRVGDSMTEGEDLRFTGIPNFAPEILRRVRLGDPMKAKPLRRALDDLAEEGVTQVFKPLIGSQWIIGVVGSLQVDVLKTRIEGEYNVAVDFESSPYITARWLEYDDPAQFKDFQEFNRGSLAEDRDGNPVFMARNQWDLDRAQQDYPGIKFLATRERA